MVRQPSFYNPPLPPDMKVDQLSREQARAVFATTLQQATIDRGRNQSDLAREAAKQMPDKKLGRDPVSNYVRARIFPSPAHLKALARSLGVTAEKLPPSRGVPRVPMQGANDGPLGVQDVSEGNC